MRTQARKRTPVAERKGDYVGFRSPRQLKERLTKSALACGRSLSTEAQFRLEVSFRDDDVVTQALDRLWGPDVGHTLQQIGQIMISIAPLAVGTSATPEVGAHFGQWMQNAHAREKMVRGAIAYLNQLLPSADELAAAARAKAEPAGEQEVHDLIIAADEPEKHG